MVDTFVPNDTYLVGGAGIGVAPKDDNDNEVEDEQSHIKNSVMVCTGANACGKVVSSAIHSCAIAHPCYQSECISQADCFDPIHGSGVYNATSVIWPRQHPAR